MYLQSIHLVSTFPACPHCRFRGCLAGLVSSWIGWKMHTAQLPQDLGLPRGLGSLESTNRGLGKRSTIVVNGDILDMGLLDHVFFGDHSEQLQYHFFWGWTSLDTSYCRVERQATRVVTICLCLPQESKIPSDSGVPHELPGSLDYLPRFIEIGWK